MTPAINSAKKAGIKYQLHSFKHDPACTDFGMEAANAIGAPPEQVFKTLITQVDNELVMALLPVNKTLCLKALAQAAGGKKAQLAEIKKAERTTGYIKGGISPLGQKKRLRAFIDDSAQELPEIIVSAGRRGLQIALAPTNLKNLVSAHFHPLTSA